MRHSETGMPACHEENCNFVILRGAKRSRRIRALHGFRDYARNDKADTRSLPGKHQSGSARRKTLANLAAIFNTGKLYNYFCPQDGVVSLPNVQGMGWKGIGDADMKALGPNVFQRVFARGHIVGAGPEQYRVTDYAGLVSPDDAPRNINAASLPESYAFKIQDNEPKEARDSPDLRRAATALAEEGAQPACWWIDAVTGEKTAVEGSIIVHNRDGSVYMKARSPDGGEKVISRIDKSALDNPGPIGKDLERFGLDPKQIVSSWQSSAGEPYLLIRYETKEEGIARIQHRKTKWSQHSAIPLNAETVEKCMAYDVAVGVNTVFDPEDGETWQSLLRLADWRNPENPDREARDYFEQGILPPDIKKQMHKPNPALVSADGKYIVKEFAPDMPKNIGLDERPSLMAMVNDDAYFEPDDVMPWPLPRPDESVLRKKT
jgi:hypothetical protein